MFNVKAFLLLGTLALLAAAASAAVVDVSCGNTTDDTTALNGAIGKSKAGDSIRVHGTCLVNATIVLFGDRSYIGDSRTGTVIRQANGANLPALLASDSWDSNAAGTGRPIRIAHMTLDGNRGNNAGTSGLRHAD